MNISNQELSNTLEAAINNTKIFDIHTHLFPSVFKSHSLSGFINLLNYHYLIAELLTNANAPTAVLWAAVHSLLRYKA